MGKSVVIFLKRIALWVGNIQVRLVLAAFYFVVVAPFALLVRCADDPLALKPRTKKGWLAREPAPEPAEHAMKQF